MNQNIFLGKPLHWALWPLLIGLLYLLGANSFHVKHFVAFCLILLALAAFCVGVIVVTYRPGDRITRESFDHPHDPVVK